MRYAIFGVVQPTIDDMELFDVVIEDVEDTFLVVKSLNESVMFKLWVETEEQKDIMFEDLKELIDTTGGTISWHECSHWEAVNTPCVIAESYTKEVEEEVVEPTVVEDSRFPTQILLQTNQNGTIADISNSENNESNTWLVPSNTNDTALRVAFGVYSEELDGQQVVSVLVHTSGSRVARTTIRLLEGDAELASEYYEHTNQVHHQFMFNPTDVTDITGSNLCVEVTSTHGGGSPNDRSVAQVGAIVWYARYLQEGGN
jgi:hypothetical protein